MKRHSPPRLTLERFPPEWGRMPRQLILELEEPIRQFRQALVLADHYDYEITDFVNEILIYIRVAFIDLESLGELVELTGEHFPEDAHILQPAVEQLGKSLLSRLHVCGVHTSDGLVHYCVGRWLNDTTPVLVRYMELSGQYELPKEKF